MSDFRFLYRQSEGKIDRRQWWLASIPPTLIVLAFTAVWILISPRARDLSQENFFDLGIAIRYAYLMVFTFVLFMCAIVQYFVSAKRFADRRMQPALAGVLPFAIFIAGAANWYQPRSEGYAPFWLAWIFDAVALAVLGWTVYELGLAPQDADK